MVLALLLSCASYGLLSDAGYYEGGTGAEAGGVRDIAYARDVIAHGGVPTSADLTYEGLFGEHDVPVAGAPCGDLLCVRPDVGTAPWLLTGTDATFVQLGMASGLPSPYVRPPVDLVFVLDKSSAMSGDMDQVETAVADALGQLRADDRVAIVTFDSRVHIVQALGAPSAELADEVAAIDAGGGFDIDAGVAAGFAQLGPRDDTRVRRLVLLTCGYPSSEAFFDAVTDAAADGIGTSVYGVLLGWEPTIGDILADTRGGAYGYLMDLEATEQVFHEDFDLEVAPIAYDLAVALDLPDGWALDGVYGVPASAAVAPAFEVRTVFPSRSHGAVFARVQPADGEMTASIAYDPEPAQGWTAAVATSEAVTASGGPGVRIGAALVNQIAVMKVACDEYYAGDAASAEDRLRGLAAYLHAEAAETGDASLDTEGDLATKLADNL